MDERKRILISNKAIATALMLGAAVLFVVARSRKGGGVWEWVAAFAEAAMVGALADWFAVVALFRHPLGVPIPHTAIIKSKKDAIAGSLADFIRDKFLATDTLVARLREYDPAEHLAAYLMARGNADRLASLVSRLLGESLDFIDDPRVQQLVGAALHDRVEKFDLASSAGMVIETLRKGNRHQIVLDDLLNRAARWLAGEEAQAKLAAAIDDMCTREYPFLSLLIPNRDQFTRGVGEKIIRRVNAFIQEVNADPLHEVRYRFDGAVTAFTSRLESDPALRRRVEELKREAVNNPFLSEYVRSISADLKEWLGGDLRRSDSAVTERIAAAVSGLGATLACNREVRESLNDHLEALLIHYGDTLRTGITRHISGTVRQWDTAEYINEIELSIGSDLQFIRMNGTLVGGMIGLLLHGVGLLIG